MNDIGMGPSIDIDGLHVELDSDSGLVRAIDAMRLSLASGQTFALVGESGCGKSMTALALMRLLPDNGHVTAGTVRLGGENLLALPESRMRAVRGGRIGMIFQEPGTSLNPVMRIGEQIVESIEAHTPLRGAAARERALAWLRRVGIPEPERRIDEHAFQLSGGQKQRVMIAMTLAAEPDFLIADEPTTALDVTIQAQVLALLRELQQERRMGMLLITHDLAVVSRMAHRVALMYAGQIVDVADAPDFFAAPQHPYARLLLNALPDAGKRGRALAAIPGTVPSLTQPFTGCRFGPRCDRVMAACANTPPPLLPSGANREVRCLLFAPGATLDRTPATREAVVAPLPADRLATPADGAALLDVRGLSVRYAARRRWPARQPPPHTVVDAVSLQIGHGRTLALVGESGSGKTTTGKAIVQLLRGRAEVEGQVLLEGQDLGALDGAALRQMRAAVQIVFQDPFASLNPRLRVQLLLEEGLLALRPEMDAPARRQRVTELLARVGLRAYALDRYPHEFSGGQRQRLAIARALAVGPKLIVCDEPTSALDVSVQAQILNLLRELQSDLGVSYVFITHNIGVVEYIADHIAVMRQGRIEEAGPAHEVLHRPTSDYTRQLLAAVPRIAGTAVPAAPA